MSSSQLTNSIIFQRGRLKAPTSETMWRQIYLDGDSPRNGPKELGNFGTSEHRWQWVCVSMENPNFKDCAQNHDSKFSFSIQVFGYIMIGIMILLKSIKYFINLMGIGRMIRFFHMFRWDSGCIHEVDDFENRGGCTTDIAPRMWCDMVKLVALDQVIFL